MGAGRLSQFVGEGRGGGGQGSWGGWGRGEGRGEVIHLTEVLKILKKVGMTGMLTY